MDLDQELQKNKMKMPKKQSKIQIKGEMSNTRFLKSLSPVKTMRPAQTPVGEA